MKLRQCTRLVKLTHIWMRYGLGEILFTDPAIKRGPLEVASLRSGQSLFELAKHSSNELNDSSIMWARRSCFYFADNSLLVCEIFLPNQGWS